MQKEGKKCFSLYRNPLFSNLSIIVNHKIILKLYIMKLTTKNVLRFMATCAFCTLVSVTSSCGGDAPDAPDPTPKPTPEEPTPTPEPEPTPVPGESAELRIMSFNMRYPASTDTGTKSWDSRKEPCVAMIKEQMPDVIAAQELRTAQREDLKKMLPEYSFVEIPNTGTGSGANIVMLYLKNRFSLIESGHFFLSFTPDSPSRCFNVGDSQMRASVWLHLKDNNSGKEFIALGTHFPTRAGNDYESAPYEEARILSAELCIERLRIKAGNDMMCFLMGDLNCSWKDKNGNTARHGSQVQEVLLGWMKDARDEAKDLTPAGITSYNAFGSGSMTPNRIIDHIFFRNAETIDFNTITKSYNGISYLSDHYPIMLRVKL